jgi:glucokinase
MTATRNQKPQHMFINIKLPSSHTAQSILAADIGASKTNMAVYVRQENELTLKKEATFKTKQFTDPVSLIEAFLSGDKMPERICLAVAGPVSLNAVNLTNINWQINGDELTEKYHQPVTLLNDLEATAYGLPMLTGKDIHTLHKGNENIKGNVAVIAPGTGLGEAGLYSDGKEYHPFAGEGGHCSFSPQTEMDIELLHFIRIKKKYDHVSWERLVSGPGICTIYDFLKDEKEREEPAWLKEKILAHDKAAIITENANECDICKETVTIFLRYLAEESANLVLKLKATGGLFIAGGILPNLIPVINTSNFVKCFTRVGRLKPLLESVPVHVVLNKKAPLLGAVYYGAGVNLPARIVK